MKSRIIHLAIMAITIGTISTACDMQPKKTADLQRINDSMEHPHDQVDTLNADRQDWEKFKIDAQDRMRKNQDTIEAFKKRVDAGNQKTKAKYDERIAHLEEYNRQLKKRVEDYQEEGRANWTKFKQTFNSDMDTLGQRINEVFTDK